jgi:hypothetical protein
VGLPFSYLHNNTPFLHGLCLLGSLGGLWEYMSGVFSLLALQNSTFTWIICLLGDFRNHGNLWAGLLAICIARLHFHMDYIFIGET